MTRTPRTDSLAFLTICLAGCALSPIVDGDFHDESEADSGFETSQGMASEPDEEEPGVDPNAAPSDDPPPPPTSTGSAARADASARPSSPAEGALRDAGVMGADLHQDAGIKDAGVKDAGRPSTSTPTPTPARDAGQSTTKPAAGMCRSASDCRESCAPVGIFNCCRANGTCGCTWALGAYCL